MAKVVISAGLPRSGSTWQFNAMRLILDHADITYYAAFVKDYDPTRPEPWHIIKAHHVRLIPDHYFRVIYSHRRIVECLASLMRMGWLPEVAADVKERHRSFKLSNRKWRRIADMKLPYWAMRRWPVWQVRRMARTLGVPVSRATAQQIVDQVEALGKKSKDGAGKTDPVTQLHPGHRSDGSYQAEYVARVRALLRA